MGKLFIAVAVAVATFALVESLTCNKCSASIFGFCLSSSNGACDINQTCYTEKISFPAISSFRGVVRQGCRVNDIDCNTNTTSTKFTIEIRGDLSCCSTDKCNTVDLSGAAPDLKMTFLVTVVGGVLASMWGSFL